MTFLDEFNEDVSKINAFIEKRLKEQFAKEPHLETLLESFLYSLQSGGKRFRPLLAVFVAKTFKRPIEQVLPYAAAVEFVHTYSLIHDDLPSMDNDDYRRGKLTNHKVYGEAMAILAGDGLLTEAFSLIADSYLEQPAAAIQMVKVLSESSGAIGMVGGQVLDIRASKAGKATLEELLQVHRLKTGCLIYAAVYGAGLALSLPQNQLVKLQEYGRELGFAFQVADDIEDFLEGKIEGSGLPQLIGVADCEQLLLESSNRAKKAIANLTSSSEQHNLLIRLVDFNSDRLTGLKKNSLAKNNSDLTV
jgi:geranylgeranyl diphosphate synthase type II